MANVEKLSIAPTPESASRVRGAVESGDYASTGEVVREALWEWKQRRTLQQRNIEELRRRAENPRLGRARPDIAPEIR